MVCVRLAPTFKNLNCGNGVLESNIKKRKKVQTEYMSKSTTYSTQLFMQMYGEVFFEEPCVSSVLFQARNRQIKLVPRLFSFPRKIPWLGLVTCH